MADLPRRHIAKPIKGDRWRYQSVYGHISSGACAARPRVQYQARVADRCEVGKGCCALRILENGLTEEQRVFAEKEYQSHRRETCRITV
jgi:hypothetical protein